MKLTEKDKEFIEKLKMLIEDSDLKIELKEDGLKRFVLRRNYGDKIERIFGLSRQGSGGGSNGFWEISTFLHTPPSIGWRAYWGQNSGRWLLRSQNNESN